jgi:hypothetical protein
MSDERKFVMSNNVSLKTVVVFCVPYIKVWLMMMACVGLSSTISKRALAESRSPAPATRSRCLSSNVPLDRSWDEERNADLNREFNDYAAIYLDSMSPDCKAVALAALNNKLEGTLNFADQGGTVTSPPGEEVHPFKNWLWGASVTHLFASALELQYDGLSLRSDLLERARDVYASIPDRQDANCGIPTNGCMDDYGLTASGFGWVAAYEAKSGRDPQEYIERAKGLLSKFFQPMSASGSVCYYVKGSDPVRCDGSPSQLVDGHVEIIGIGHGQENPNYGLGLMSAVASACLALYLADSPCDFNTVDASTGLSWKQISTALLNHARGKTNSPSAFSSNCLNFSDPLGPPVPCSDFGYSPNLYPLSRFFVSMTGLQAEEFQFGEFRFDRFDPNYEFRQPETMFSRTSFWGLNRYVFYNLFANEAYPGGSLNAHFRRMKVF